MIKLFRVRRARGRRRERGQALVEFALVMPLLMLLFVGIVDVADALQAYISVQSASRDGARLGSRGETDAHVTDLVRRDLERMRNPGIGQTMVVTHTLVSGVDAIQVKACKDHELIVSYPLLPVPDPIHICAQTTMVVLKKLS